METTKRGGKVVVRRKGSLIEVLDPSKGTPIEFESLSRPVQSTMSALEDKLDIDWTQAYTFPKTSEVLDTTLVIGRSTEGDIVRYVRRLLAGEGGPKHTLYVGDKRINPRLLVRSLKEVQTAPFQSSFEEEFTREQKKRKEGVGKVIAFQQEVWKQNKLVPFNRKLGITWTKVSRLAAEGVTRHGEPVTLDEYRKITLGGTSFVPQEVLNASDRGFIKGYSTPSVVDIVEGTEDYLALREKAREFEKAQMKLRERGHRLFGGPGFYERYLKGLERPGFLYHVTPRANVESILKEGLTKTMGGMGERYMGELKYISEKYLPERGPGAAILEIDTTRLNPRKIVEKRADVFAYEGDIPPEAITELRWIRDY